MRFQPDTKGIMWLELDETSQQLLKNAIEPLYDTRNPKVQLYHHVTWLYGAPFKDVEPLLSKAIRVETTYHAYDWRVQAVRVRPLSQLEGEGLPETTYGVPHITLSVNEGVIDPKTNKSPEPYTSVDMLKSEERIEVAIRHMVLAGIMAFRAL